MSKFASLNGGATLFLTTLARVSEPITSSPFLIAPPFKQANFDILYGEGISREGEILELGVKHNIVEKSGAWYGYKKDRIGQGKDNAREYLKEHPELAVEIEARVREAVGVNNPAAAPAPALTVVGA